MHTVSFETSFALPPNCSLASRLEPFRFDGIEARL